MKCSLSVLERKRKANKAANKALHKIGEKLGIPIDLTTYVARHSYATVLKRSGVSTAIISESLGHSSEKVTQIYLDSFENTQIDEASGQSGVGRPLFSLCRLRFLHRTADQCPVIIIFRKLYSMR